MKTFVDAGYYSGKALDYYAPLMDETWKVYAFEPNKSVKIDASRFPFKLKVIRKAIWTHDGSIGFSKVGRGDAAHIDHSSKKTVPCVDFSKFIDGLEGEIICSMDAEGAEFPVLEKMLAEGTAKRIALLDVEFHHRLVKDRDEEDARRIIRALQLEGVLVKVKVEI